MKKIRLVKRKDGTGYYADESGKFFDPYVAAKNSFTIVGEIQESAGARSAGVEKVTESSKALAQLKTKERQFDSYKALGLTDAEARLAAGLETKVKENGDLFALMVDGLQSKRRS